MAPSSANQAILVALVEPLEDQGRAGTGSVELPRA